MLEKEKMHTFKRVYLLISLLASFISPLITISFIESQQSFVSDYIFKEPVDLITKQSAITAGQTFDRFATLFIFIYLTGLIAGLIRLVNTIIRIHQQASKAESVIFQKTKLILLEKDILPHSFLNKIFLNKEGYLKGKIEKNIFVHELAHVKQYHSLDILFVRFILCIFWFNPFYLLYLRVIQLNHEFLADEAVLHASGNPLSYQHLLLQTASGRKSFSLTSRFNYSIIKKRLVMITKNKQPQTLLLKKIAAISLFLITTFLFTTKETIGQKTEPAKGKHEVPSTSEGASAQLIAEYETIVAKHRNAPDKTHFLNSSFSEPEKERLFTIYTMMTKEQQEKQAVGFVPKPALKNKKYPTDEQLKTWLDSKKYFVRIDGWKIDNNRFGNYKASDFDYYEFYKPNKGSTDYGKYEAQINLMTKSQYAKYAKAWDEQSQYLLVFRKKY